MMEVATVSVTMSHVVITLLGMKFMWPVCRSIAAAMTKLQQHPQA